MPRHHSCLPRVEGVEPLALTSSAPLAGASPLGPVRGSAGGARQWIVVGAAQAVTAVIVSLGPPRQPTRRRCALLGARGVAQLGSQAPALLQLLPVGDLLLPLLLFQLWGGEKCCSLPVVQLSKEAAKTQNVKERVHR